MATIASWACSSFQKGREMFHVVIEDPDGISAFSLPADVSAGTRDRAEEIFGEITGDDTEQSILARRREF